MRNVIVLTSGLSGSSVLTSLIARAGYWTGETTVKKPSYDTFENAELVRANLRIIEEAGYEGNYLEEFSWDALQRIGALPSRVDLAPYRAFVAKCDLHRPWIWKDPRLWLTIRFWSELLDLDSCRFILLTRGHLQTWVSSTLHRRITTYRYAKAYEESIRTSILQFLTDRKLAQLEIRYEDLIGRPAETIDALNQFIGTELSVAHLEAVYTKSLYKNPRPSSLDFVKAVLIYLKNFNERKDAPAKPTG
jgi:hypothetical protein